MKKLTEIQNELKAPKNQYNAFGKYKYRSCEDILEAVKPLLKKHDCTLTITDEVRRVGGIVFIEAIATITDSEGGQVAKAQAGIDPNRKGMDIAQSFGSSSSYARKYALNGLFLIDDTKDADATNDHGQQTKPQPKAQTAQQKSKPELKPDTEQWKKAIDFLVKGGLISKVEAGYALSEVNKQLLMDVVLEKA